jgi:hypothetical protein
MIIVRRTAITKLCSEDWSLSAIFLLVGGELDIVSSKSDFLVVTQAVHRFHDIQILETVMLLAFDFRVLESVQWLDVGIEVLLVLLIVHPVDDSTASDSSSRQIVQSAVSQNYIFWSHVRFLLQGEDRAMLQIMTRFPMHLEIFLESTAIVKRSNVGTVSDRKLELIDLGSSPSGCHASTHQNFTASLKTWMVGEYPLETWSVIVIDDLSVSNELCSRRMDDDFLDA